MGMLGNIRYRWSAVHRNFLRSQSQATDRTSLLTAMTKFVRNSNQSLMIGLGVLELLQGRMTSGMMIASSMLLGRALMPIEMLIMNWRGLLTARNAYSRLQELLEQFPETLPGMPLPKPAGRIDFENVSAVAPFSKTPILHNIALTIPAGKTVAVIGPSAAGKSTLSRLLVGVWPASEGVVRLDDFDVFAWDKDSLGPHIGYLPQDIELFDGTLAENICRFGQIDSEKVIRAAQLVGMHETILHFPKGYDTPLGDSGCYLSGGQRQRIGLARALYGDPSLIVLDEPNSSLDDAGVQALIVTLQALKKANRTVVLITHQLNLLNLVDSILVLADGAVRLYGPRDEVIAALSGAQRKSAAVTSEKSLAGSSS
jgi:ATP-binding cassette subfamily C exporter for protease/lipase